MANSVKFVSTTLSTYKAITTPDANTLYFLSDTTDVYKGAVKYTGGVIVYATTRPATGIENRLYVDSTGANGASIYSGGSWIQVAGSVSQTVLSGGNAVTGAVSGAAVKAYIDGLALAKSTDVVTALAYDPATAVLSYTKNGAAANLSLTKLGNALSYDAKTGIISLKDAAGTEISTVNIPLDNFVKSGAYNATDNALELTMANGGVVSIPASDLVKIYSATDSSTVDITIVSDGTGKGNEITATVKISATANNALVANADGLFVDSAAIIASAKTVGVAEDSDKIVTVDANGKIAVGTLKASTLATASDVAAAALTWTVQ